MELCDCNDTTVCDGWVMVFAGLYIDALKDDRESTLLRDVVWDVITGTIPVISVSRCKKGFLLSGNSSSPLVFLCLFTIDKEIQITIIIIPSLIFTHLPNTTPLF